MYVIILKWLFWKNNKRNILWALFLQLLLCRSIKQVYILLELRLTGLCNTKGGGKKIFIFHTSNAAVLICWSLLKILLFYMKALEWSWSQSGWSWTLLRQWLRGGCSWSYTAPQQHPHPTPPPHQGLVHHRSTRTERLRPPKCGAERRRRSL